MLRKSFVFLAVGMVIFFFASASSADVPDSINYQGKLTTASGGCLNDTVQMTFTIYADAFGTVWEWSETQTQVEVKEGIFNVLLGSVNPLPASIFDGRAKYLGVQVESDPEMSPLKPMVTTAYAFGSHHAQEADTAEYARAAPAMPDDDWVINGDTIYHEQGNVGIGTTSPNPASKLHLKSDPSVYVCFDHGRDTIWLVGSNIVDDQSLSILEANQYGSVTRARFKVGGDIHLAPASGNVGIGMPNPTEKLDVAGNIHASGTISSGSSITIDGVNDKITATSGTIDFDDENLVTTGKATIGPGHSNTGVYAFVAGQNNTATNYYSTVGGGSDNMAGSDGSTVGGGVSDTASGIYSTVGGGAINVARGQHSTIGGGNVNLASGNYSTVSGGGYDTASGTASCVGGGGYNVASGDYAAVGGGFYNRARGQYSVVSGGGGPTGTDSNSAIGDYSTVGGGRGNIAAASHAAIGGGYENLVQGDYSGIPGGYADTITSTADYSYLFGIGSKLTADSTFMVDMPHIHFGDETNGYEFPTSDGSNGQVMSTDGSGQLSWVNVSGGGGGWVDDGTVVRLQTSTDYVGIGTTSPTRKLDVNGTGYFSGDVRIDGNLGVHTDPVPEGKVSMNNIFLYDDGTFSGPFIKVSGHNEARLLLESRRVAETSGKTWYIQSGGGAHTYLDMFSISNPADGECFVIRDGGVVGIGEMWPKNRLDVEGAVAVGTNYSGSSTAPTDGMIVEGNVGIGTTSPQGALDVSSTTGAFIVPRMTTAQREALSAVNGMIIYNTTTNQFNFYENGAWITK